MPKLSHYDRSGRARMVDISAKAATTREAQATAFVAMTPAVLNALSANPKGDPFETARLAGIMAAKKTAELIPLCHPLQLSHIDVELMQCENGIAISTSAKTTAETGVEMEALVAASVAALTIYDMCKALERGMTVSDVYVLRKSGGRSGLYSRPKKHKK